MKRLSLVWTGSLIVVAVLSGCTAEGRLAQGGVPGGLPGIAIRTDAALTMAHFVQEPVHPDHSKSWMAPSYDPARRHKRRSALVYVGDWATNDVFVYEYKSGKEVGQLTGFSDPYGMCVDAKGDIYITNFGSGTVEEYAHGGTTPINTYEPEGELIGCAVDSEDDLAVTSFSPGAVTVYAGGDPSKGTSYSDTSCEYLWTMGYDKKGDLIGTGESNSIYECALLAGKKTMQTLSSSGKIAIDFPGGVTWDGKYIAISDQESGTGFGGGGIIQAKLKGTRLIYVGKTVLLDNCYSNYVDDVNPFIVGATNALWNDRQGNTVVGPNLWCYDAGAARVDYWHYPSGGLPFKTLPSVPREPYGAGVSLGTKVL